MEEGVTPESVTLEFFQDRNPSFDTPKVMNALCLLERSVVPFSPETARSNPSQGLAKSERRVAALLCECCGSYMQGNGRVGREQA
jgi:hypothetical protein